MTEQITLIIRKEPDEKEEEQRETLEKTNPFNKKKVFTNKYNNKFLNAAQLGDLDTVKYCVEKKVNVNATDTFRYTAIMHACEMGYFEIVKYLFELGANISSSNYGTLRLAAMQNQTEIVQYLLENGADYSIFETTPNINKEVKVVVDRFINNKELKEKLDVELISSTTNKNKIKI